jgi:hypothetical protein
MQRKGRRPTTVMEGMQERFGFMEIMALVSGRNVL